jgi:methyl coenzyme M reductase subunit C
MTTIIDILREDIAETFRDKLKVSMIPGDSHIGDPMIADLTITHTLRELGYPISQKILGD